MRMVKDRLERHSRYHVLGERFVAALTHAASGELHGLADGRHDIAPGVTVQIQHYETKPDHEVRWEAHRAHIDLQLLISGQERIGIAAIESLVAEPYDAERDLLWLDGDGDSVTLGPNEFVLLWPEDAHRPGVAIDSAESVRKAVYKIACR